jgi:uncharacterized protein
VLSETQHIALLGYFEQHPEILSAYLFGSFAKGTATPSSDVDLALFLAKTPGIAWITDTTAALSKQLGREVDLILLNNASPFLKFQVFRYGKLLFERDRKSLSHFLASSLIEYYDYEPLKRIMENKVIDRLKENLR